MVISNVTDSQFDFEIYDVEGLCFKHHTAVAISEDTHVITEINILLHLALIHRESVSMDVMILLDLMHSLFMKNGWMMEKIISAPLTRAC